MEETTLLREVNAYNTPLDGKYYEDLSREVIEDIHSCIDEIVFIRRLVSENIKSVSDIEKDEDGKIIIDITDPHRLENMSYFTAAADHFRKHGCYTLLTPNKHPKSAYYQYWKEEKRRIRDGLIREDGEWIPGSYYWYLNYCPIMLTKRQGTKGKRADRINDFANVWLGDYLFFHYKNQAEFIGEHIEALKCRGIGASFKMGSIGPRNALFKPRSKTFYVASNMQYLTKDGVLTKSWDYLDFNALNTPFPRLKLKDTQLEKRIGYKDIRSGAEKGMKSDIIGLSTNDDPDKIRGKRGDIIFEEYGSYPHIKKAWNVSRDSVEDGENVFGQMCGMGCVCAGTKVWQNDGSLVNIEDLDYNKGIIGFDDKSQKASLERITNWNPPANKECVRITTNTQRVLECSIDHPILWSTQSYGKTVEKEKVNGFRRRVFKKGVAFKEAEKIFIGDQVAVINEVPIWGTKRMWNPRLIGWLIGDGSYGKNKTPVLSNCEEEINSYVEKNFNSITEKSYITKDHKVYKETRIKDICGELRNIGIYGQTRNNKRLPLDIHSYSREDILDVIGGLFDTDGHVTTDGTIGLTSSCLELIKEVQLLLQKFGIHGNVLTQHPREKNPIDRNDYYLLEIRDRSSALNFSRNIKLFPQKKQDRLDAFEEFYRDIRPMHASHLPGMRFERVVSVERIGLKPIYNLTAGNTHTYIANGIITHNTGGEEGADFEGAEDMFYHPKSYNIMALPNVFDRNTEGKGECGFFWGAYLNRANCYDSNGMPDVTKALRELYLEFDRVRKSSSDPRILTQRRAEKAITPQDSMMRIDGTVFPVGDIRDYLERILPTLDEFVGPHYIGDLMFDSNGKVAWRVGGYKKPIREFPLQDNKHEGAIEIFEMPHMVNGEAQRNRYIAGIDGYDDDTSNTVSLGSIFVLDLFTDRIVAEYTGRPKFANDFFEICRRMLLFYNAIGNYENDKKGMFGYFDRKNSLHLLSDTLQSLKDVEMVRGNLYGNKSKGTNSGRFINARARRLSADYMLTDAHGEDKDKNVLNLHKIRSIGLLLEALKWNVNGNFDRISAMGMLMLLREDRQKYLENAMSGETDRSTSMAFDEYFRRNSRGTLKL